MLWPKLMISVASLFIAFPLVLAMLRYRHLNAAMKAIAFYVLLGGIIQLYSSYLNEHKQNNLWLLHLYTPLEFSCIVWFYSTILQGFIKERLFSWVAIGFTILSAMNSAFLQDTLTFNTYARSLEGILVIIFCLTWCYRTLLEMKIQELAQDAVFWVNTGFLLYFSGGVLLFAFSNAILDINRALILYIWAFHATLSILLYLFISIGLWKAK